MHSLSSLPYLICEPFGHINLLLSYGIIGDFAKNFSEEVGDRGETSVEIRSGFGIIRAPEGHLYIDWILR